MNYTQHFSTKKTPQTEPIPGMKQVQNSAGGFVFEVDDWKRLERFLILGSEGGTYYTSEKKLTVENAQCVLRCLDSEPKRTVDTIVQVSVEGRAPKNDPAIFALAMAANHEKGKVFALPDAVLKVCRIGTHLFQFVAAVKSFRGFGRSLQRAINQWYLSQEVENLVYQVIKYQQREGWSHRDILRLTHPKGEGIQNSVLGYIAGKISPENLMGVGGLEKIVAFDRIKKVTNKKDAVRLIEEFDLPRECVPTQFLTEPSIWEALLKKMPLHAMVRNLGNMSKCDLLKPLSNASNEVVKRLSDQEKIRKSRLHPLALLTALMTYKTGHGLKGSGVWTPVGQVVDALDKAFYLAFQNVEPTNKRWMLALDVSGSMVGSRIDNLNLSAREGSAAMALVTANVEPQHCFMAFSSGFIPLNISPRQRLDDVVRSINNLPFDATDCAQPMLYATKHKIAVDVFVIYTDSETFAGGIHPIQALKDYRQKMGIGAKLITVGMTSNGFSIADPNDGGSLDVVGFDTSTPDVMANFVRE